MTPGVYSRAELARFLRGAAEGGFSVTLDIDRDDALQLARLLEQVDSVVGATGDSARMLRRLQRQFADLAAQRELAERAFLDRLGGVLTVPVMAAALGFLAGRML